ncbi:hypothetical protein ACHAPT_012076 [Fusarium lateritium]
MSDMLRFKESRAQDGSPFFTKLPPEIRRMVYRELFGDRRVHIASKETLAAVDGTPNYSTPQEDTSSLSSPGWTHHVCLRDDDAIPHLQAEDHDKSCHLATQILRTCKQAFEDGIRLLYTSNIFAFDGGHDLSRFAATTPSTNLIRSIQVHCDKMTMDFCKLAPLKYELGAITKTLEKCQAPPNLHIRFSLNPPKNLPAYMVGKHEDESRWMISVFLICFMFEFFRLVRGPLNLAMHHEIEEVVRAEVLPLDELRNGLLTLTKWGDDELEVKGEETGETEQSVEPEEPEESTED